MKKRMFFALFLFVMLFTAGAWQFAAAELDELQEETATKENILKESKEVRSI